jgi:hypothetical protein
LVLRVTSGILALAGVVSVIISLYMQFHWHQWENGIYDLLLAALLIYVSESLREGAP